MASSASSEQQEPCRLLDLPPELRLLIWEAYFSTDLIQKIAKDPEERKRAAFLLSTCRTIFFEATPKYRRSLRREVNAMVIASEALKAEVKMRKKSCAYKDIPDEAKWVDRKETEMLQMTVTAKKLAGLEINKMAMFLQFVLEAKEQNTGGNHARANGKLEETHDLGPRLRVTDGIKEGEKETNVVKVNLSMDSQRAI
ncbi:hypothetical protein PRZ48_012591 [Zasmidium cellare]|uniref:Uncharacterized protein n=1 Tax=Zasmidium cellare TaxID=395010 RepID=A0ABR0E5V3_ZASCE|nr:hypothetical protein PRZ48_012591 [Zasmidium cellare]